MIVRLNWKTILGVISVFVIGCGSTDNPVGEETPELPNEPPTQVVSPILGDWRLLEIIWFKDGAETQRTGPDFLGWYINKGPLILTLAPDGIFEAMRRFPIEDVAHISLLESLGLEHIQEIVISYRGKYHIRANQLRLNLIVTRVAPMEAPQIESDFAENSDFLILAYDVWYNDGGSLDYSLSDNGNQLELRREEGEYMVKFIHRRPNTE